MARNVGKKDRGSDSMKRSDSTSGLENAITADNAVEAYQAINGDTSIHEQIAKLAYEFYLQRVAAGGPGSPEEDWSRAEAELRQSMPRDLNLDV